MQEEGVTSPYKVRAGSFEGPLELLLSLIEQRKLFVNEISLALQKAEFPELYIISEMNTAPDGAPETAQVSPIPMNPMHKSMMSALMNNAMRLHFKNRFRDAHPIAAIALTVARVVLDGSVIVSTLFFLAILFHKPFACFSAKILLFLRGSVSYHSHSLSLYHQYESF